MRVFISWSKPTSLQLAMLLREWLPEVIQQVTPWVSSEDIAKGKRWSGEIAGQLEATGQGLLCVTKDNVSEPWLNFEAGALAKSVEDARVTPLLLGLKPRELVGPLAEFQAAEATDRADMRRLMESLNEVCAAPLTPELLGRAFDRAWPDYERRVNGLLAAHPEEQLAQEAPARAVEDMVGEVLDRVRRLERLVEQQPEPSRPEDVKSSLRVRGPILGRMARQELAREIDHVIAEEAPPRDVLVTPSGNAHIMFLVAPANLDQIKTNLRLAFTNSPLRRISIDVHGSGEQHLVDVRAEADQ